MADNRSIGVGGILVFSHTEILNSQLINNLPAVDHSFLTQSLPGIIKANIHC